MSRKWKFFLAGAVILIAMEWRALYYYLMPPPDYSDGNVILYATDWCPYCEKTRLLLAQHHIPYKEYDIETSSEGKQQYQRLAGKGVPILLVAGEVIRGYNEKRIVAVLEQWRSARPPAKPYKEDKANR